MVVCTGLLFLLNTAGGKKCTDPSVTSGLNDYLADAARTQESGALESWIKSRESGQLTVLKVELVEVHALHQVPQRLGLKRGQSGVTDSPEEQTDVNQNDGHGLVCHFLLQN